MISYNRLNGIHVAENPNLLQNIVRNEWGFDGMFMSDWFGTYSVDIGINAGVDLEMPGVNKWRTLDSIKRCVAARKVTVRAIKDRALQVLKVVQKCAQEAPEVGAGSLNLLIKVPSGLIMDGRFWMGMRRNAPTRAKKRRHFCERSPPRPSSFSRMTMGSSRSIKSRSRRSPSLVETPKR